MSTSTDAVWLTVAFAIYVLANNCSCAVYLLRGTKCRPNDDNHVTDTLTRHGIASSRPAIDPHRDDPSNYPGLPGLIAEMSIYIPRSRYNCIIPELVPPDQRGTAGGFFMVFNTLGGLSSAVIGYLVGDQYITEAQAYGFLIAINALDMIIGLIGLGKKPGLAQPEAPPAIDAVAKARDEATSMHPTLRGEQPSSCSKVCEFVSAFKKRSYLWLFIYMFTFASMMTVSNMYLAYWVQDVLGDSKTAPSYSLFSWHLTNSPQSAVSILMSVGAIVQLPSNIIGGVLADRVGKRGILVAVMAVQVWCPLVQAFTTSFTVPTPAGAIIVMS